LCATTGWHRDHARKALRVAVTPRIVRPRRSRAPRYGTEVHCRVGVLLGRAVLGAPTGKRLPPMMGELVPRLRRSDELVISDDTEVALVAMSPGHDRPSARAGPGEDAGQGRSHTKPESLLGCR
jgi:hypothetical protein